MTSSDDEAAEQEATPSDTKRRRLVNTSPRGRESFGSQSRYPAQQDPVSAEAEDRHRFPPGAPPYQADPASYLQRARRESDSQYGIDGETGGKMTEQYRMSHSIACFPHSNLNSILIQKGAGNGPTPPDPSYLPSARDNASLLSSLSSGPSGARAAQYDPYSQPYEPSLLRNPYQPPAGGYVMMGSAPFPPGAMPPQVPPYMDPRLQPPHFNDAAGLGGYPYGRGVLPTPPFASDPAIYSDALLAQRYPLTTAAMGSQLGGGLGRAHMRRELMSDEENLLADPVARGPPDPNAITLYTEKDENALSQYQCVVRKQIEVFAAEQIDTETNAQGRNKPIVLGQVGIRCLHCSTVHPRRRARAGTYYPSKLSGFYQAAQNMASGHLCQHCTLVPPMLRRQLLILRERKSSAGGGKEYWAETVKSLGVYEDHENGILRFKKKDVEEEKMGVKESKGEAEEDKDAEKTEAAEEDKEDKTAEEGEEEKLGDKDKEEKKTDEGKDDKKADDEKKEKTSTAENEDSAEI